ncbi:MAG TPA: radical SAM protein [Methanomassiliicoccales archaeon]
MVQIRRMQAGSCYTGDLPEGCLQCRKGSKMVLLVTGRCRMTCYYCPLSERKKGKDLIFANERQVFSDEDILDEARSIGAQGTGITGGDPLDVMDRTMHYIMLLKTEFGPEHHIHLYTSTVDGKKFQALVQAGLDELRIHPQVETWEHLDLERIAESIKDLGIPVGFEVPAIPGEERGLECLIDFADRNGFDFVNLNELEFSSTNAEAMKDRGFEVIDDVSSAVKGSAVMAKGLLKKERRVAVHFCTSSFKDAVQLRNRIKRRARRVAEKHDLVTEEGLLIKGIIETTDPEAVAIRLRSEFDVPETMMKVDPERKRLEVASWILEDLYPELGMECYIIEVYPTADRLEVERRPLR